MIRTRCPACLTVFRVRPEQLQARSGHVRCGHCFRPFDAHAHALPDTAPEHGETHDSETRTAAPAAVPDEQPPQNTTTAVSQTPGETPASPSAEDRATPTWPEPETHPDDSDATDLEALLDFTIPDSFRPERGAEDKAGAESDPASTSEALDPYPERRMRPGEDHLPSFEERLAALSFRDTEEPRAELDDAAAWRPATADFDHGKDVPLVVPAAIRRRRAARQTGDTPHEDASADSATDDYSATPRWHEDQPSALEIPEAWRSSTTPSSDTARTSSPAEETETDERFATGRDITAPENHESTSVGGERRGLWGLGIGILLGMLIIQGTYVFREPIARNWPQTRPALELACNQVGCTVPYAQHASEILIDHSHLEMVRAEARIYVLEARVRNRAHYPQTYPHLELTLTDVRDRPLARRVLQPEEWLTGSEVEGAQAFQARGEVHLMLPFGAPEVEKAAGYRLYAFYP